MPKTVKEAAELDTKNGDTKRMDAIAKEMTNVRVAFDIMKDGDRAPIGHKQINCHLIFDVKNGGLQAQIPTCCRRTHDRDSKVYDILKRCCTVPL